MYVSTFLLMDSSVVFYSFDFYKQDFYEHSCRHVCRNGIDGFLVYKHLPLLEDKLFSKVIAYNLSFYGYNFSPTGLLAI